METQKDLILKAFIGVKPGRVKRLVIISPILYPNQLKTKEKPIKSILGYLVVNSDNFTFIKAPMLQSAVKDLVIILKRTKCREVLFIGAAGGLDENFAIGDVIEIKNGRKIYSFDSILEESPIKLRSLKKKGILAIDLEVKAFFLAAKKAGLKAMARLIITDLPLTKPYYLEKSQEEREAIKLNKKFVFYCSAGL